MSDARNAQSRDDTPDDDTPDVQRERSVPMEPVSDGPGQHHANVDTRHTPAPPHRASRF